jgi:hypothetical protein
MKIRDGFVSNSSSSSFTIRKRNLALSQIYMVLNGAELASMKDNPDDAWRISDDEDSISGYTCMDNFNMRRWLINEAGISEKYLEFG